MIARVHRRVSTGVIIDCKLLYHDVSVGDTMTDADGMKWTVFGIRNDNKSRVKQGNRDVRINATRE